MFGSQVRSVFVLLSAWGLAMLGTAPSFADDGPGRPQATTPVQKAENLIRPAVVYIEGDLSAYVGDNNGFFNDIDQPVKLTYSCTGFVVNPSGYVATAGHCADLGPEGARRDIVKSVVQGIAQKDPTINVDHAMNIAMSNWKVEGQNAGSPIDQTIRVARGGGSGQKAQVLPARVVEARPVSQGDVALLKVEAADMPSSELAGSGDVQVGQQVVSVGYPASTEQITDFSLEPDYKDGTISAKKADATVPVYETNAALSPGMSGGPTVGLDGRTLGINSRLPAGGNAGLQLHRPRNGPHRVAQPQWDQGRTGSPRCPIPQRPRRLLRRPLHLGNLDLRQGSRPLPDLPTGCRIQGQRDQGPRAIRRRLDLVGIAHAVVRPRRCGSPRGCGRRDTANAPPS